MSEQEEPREQSPTRTFTSPSGRTWQVNVQHLPPMQAKPGQSTAPRAVLRFRAPDLTLELLDWPADWETMDENALIRLARGAKTPSGLPAIPSRPSQGPPLRR